jgi:hypothetical protein
MPGPRVQPHIHRLSHSSFRASSAQCERAAEPWPIRPDYPHPSSPFTSRRGRPGFSHRRAFRSASYLLASGPGAGDRPPAAPRARTPSAQASARPQHPPRLGACALPTTSPPPHPSSRPSGPGGSDSSFWKGGHACVSSGEERARVGASQRRTSASPRLLLALSDRPWLVVRRRRPNPLSCFYNQKPTRGSQRALEVSFLCPARL